MVEFEKYGTNFQLSKFIVSRPLTHKHTCTHIMHKYINTCTYEIRRLIRETWSSNFLHLVSWTIIGLNCSFTITFCFNGCLCEVLSLLLFEFLKEVSIWKVQLLFSLFSLPTTKSSLHISYQHSAIDKF